MTTISLWFWNLYGILESYYWYRHFYWLLFFYFFVWAGAAGLSLVLIAVNKDRYPIDRSVHTAWGIWVGIHGTIALTWGLLDNALITWHRGLPGDLTYVLPATGLEYLVASLWLLPYVVIICFDGYVAIKLLAAPASKHSTIIA